MFFWVQGLGRACHLGLGVPGLSIRCVRVSEVRASKVLLFGHVSCRLLQEELPQHLHRSCTSRFLGIRLQVARLLPKQDSFVTFPYDLEEASTAQGCIRACRFDAKQGVCQRFSGYPR